MDVIAQRFIALGNRIIAELRRLSDSIQQHINATREADHTKEEQNGHPPEPFVARIPEGIEARKSASDARDDKHRHNQVLLVQWLLFFATAGAFGAAAYYAHYARRQWETMQDTYREIQKQTTQITNQTTTIKQQMVGADAAFINAHVEPAPNEMKGYFTLSNLGHVSAIDASAAIQVTRVELPSGTPIGKPSAYTIPPTAVVRGGSEQIGFPLDPTWVPQTYLEAGNIPKYSFKVSGTYIYNDGFGDVVNGEYCRIWMPPYKFSTKYGFTNGPGGMSPCKDFSRDFGVAMKYLQGQEENKNLPKQ